jgi:hypothetical protein
MGSRLRGNDGDIDNNEKLETVVPAQAGIHAELAK